MANTYQVTTSDLWAKNLTATFSTLTGGVTLKFEHRNPRLDSGKWKVYYDLANGTSWTETTDFDNSSQNIATSSVWIQHTVVWNSFNDFPLTDKGLVSIKVDVLDDADVITSLTVSGFALNLAPPEGDWKRPYNFGKDTTPTFEYYLPPLLRNQTIKPKLTISTTSDFSSGNSNQQTFKVLGDYHGAVASLSAVGANHTDVFVGAGHTLTTSDKISIYATDEKALNTTFDIVSVGSDKVKIAHPFTATNVGGWTKPQVPVFGSGITEYDVLAGEVNRKTIQLESPSTMSADTTYYFKIDLRCENT
jgi:hypothetical protein